MSYSISQTDSKWDYPFQETVTKIKQSFRAISAPMSSAISVSYTWEDKDKIETSIEMLERVYTFQGYMNITTYLKNNYFLIPILFEALGEIENYFPNAKNILEVVRDSDSNQEKLFLKIMSSAHNSLELLDELDENWWLDTLPRTKLKMNIDLEY